MIKNIFKTAAISLAAAVLLAGCAEDDKSAPAADSGKVSSSVTSSAAYSAPIISSAVSPVPTESSASIPTQSNPAGNNSVPESSASSAQPTESKPEQHVHVYSKATCAKPATCSCGATSGDVRDYHKYSNGICADCGKRDPNYPEEGEICNEDEHIWGDEHIESSEKIVTVTESHYIYANGFDKTLAERCGYNSTPDFADTVSGGYVNVKVTVTYRDDRYYYTCSKCGAYENLSLAQIPISYHSCEYANPSAGGKPIWWEY